MRSKKEAQKSTNDLLNEIRKARSFSEFQKSNEKEMISTDFVTRINEAYQNQGRTKTEVAKLAGMSDAYLRQVCEGRRRPTRDRLIRLGFGLHCSLDVLQELLQLCGHAQLYVRNQRDALIIHGLVHGTDLAEVDAMLIQNGEEPLFN